jgi:mono/diheme cytochrome c family protein
MKITLITALALLLGGALAAEQKPQQNGPPARNGEIQQQDATLSGDQLFQIHCGRCHQPPMALSPKAARTVLQHMRVRALLPPDQAQRILKFLAP